MSIATVNATQPQLVEVPTTVEGSAASGNTAPRPQADPYRHQPTGVEQMVAYAAGQVAYVAGSRLGISPQHVAEVPAVVQGLTRFARTGDPSQIAVGYLHGKISSYAWYLTQLAYHAAGVAFERTPAAASAAASAGAAALQGPAVRETIAEYMRGALPTTFA